MSSREAKIIRESEKREREKEERKHQAGEDVQAGSADTIPPRRTKDFDEYNVAGVHDHIIHDPDQAQFKESRGVQEDYNVRPPHQRHDGQIKPEGVKKKEGLL